MISGNRGFETCPTRMGSFGLCVQSVSLRMETVALGSLVKYWTIIIAAELAPH